MFDNYQSGYLIKWTPSNDSWSYMGEVGSSAGPDACFSSSDTPIPQPTTCGTGSRVFFFGMDTLTVFNPSGTGSGYVNGGIKFYRLPSGTWVTTAPKPVPPPYNPSNGSFGNTPAPKPGTNVPITPGAMAPQVEYHWGRPFVRVGNNLYPL